MSTKKPSYRGTQQNLYTLARKAWGYCLLYLTNLAAKNPKYTTTFVDEQLAVVDVAEALPDFANRKEEPAETYDNMQKARLAVLDEWQFLKGYSMDAYTAPLLKVKLDAAGQSHYEKALGGNLDNTAAIINAAKTFMGSNATELTNKGNMPKEFPQNFKTMGETFTTLRTTYFGKNDTKDAQTLSKDEADAAILKELRPMLRLGNRVFKNDEAKRVKFIYDRLLDEVRGNSEAGLKGKFTDAGTHKPIQGVRIRAIDTAYETISDKDGRFFLVMASGVYDIEITAPGYETVMVYKRKIEIGSKHRFSLSLEPAPVASRNMHATSSLSEMLNEATAENGVAV